jgi:hypothetical protein
MFTCEVCGREFATKFALVGHMRSHGREKPIAEQPEVQDNPVTQDVPQSPPGLDMAQLAGLVQTMIKEEVRQQVSAIEERNTQQLTKAIEGLKSYIDSSMGAVASKLASAAQEELEKRVGSQGAGGTDRMASLMTLLSALRASEGMGGIDQFTKLGQMLGSILAPIVGIWSAGASHGLQAVGYAQRMVSGQLRPEEATSQFTETTRKNIEEMFKGIMGGREGK